MQSCRGPLIWLLCPLLGATAFAGRAAAFSCEEYVRVSLAPAAPEDTIPPNARGIPLLISMVGEANLSSWKVHLTGADGAEVPLRQPTIASTPAGAGYIELRPQKPLQKGVRYQVSIEGRDFSGSFMTDAAADTAPPRWDGIRSARYVVESLSTSPQGQQEVIRYAELRIAPPQDDHTPVRSIVFAVWAAPEGRPIDYARPPMAYVRNQGGMVRLGSLDACTGNLELNKGAGVHIGLRAVDLGGNRSRPSETVIDMRRPEERP